MKTVKALLYCTKSKPFLYKTNFVSIENVKKGNLTNLLYETDIKERLYLNGEKRLALNGYIVGECDINMDYIWPEWNYIDATEKVGNSTILEMSCLSRNQLALYGKGKELYALYINNLVQYSNPKKLNEFNNSSGMPVNIAPQNMCNVIDKEGVEYVLISIQPQHLVKILNGQKTIEIRKQVLNKIKGTR